MSTLTPAPSSKDRFIAAAAEEFIDAGYDGCTIRAIAARAGTSIASLSRNWTGKRHLFDDVFGLHFGAVNRAQHQLLDMVNASDDADLTDVLYALYRPVLAPLAASGPGPASHQVYCKALSDPSEEAREIVRPLVAGVRQRIIGATRTLLPQLDEHEVFLAMTIINGTYVYPQVQGARLLTVMGLTPEELDWDRATRTLAQMVAGGLRRYAEDKLPA